MSAVALHTSRCRTYTVTIRENKTIPVDLWMMMRRLLQACEGQRTHWLFLGLQLRILDQRTQATGAIPIGAAYDENNSILNIRVICSLAHLQDDHC